MVSILVLITWLVKTENSEGDKYWSEQGNHIEGYSLILIDYSLTVYEICEFINALDGIIVFTLKILQDGGQMLRETGSGALIMHLLMRHTGAWAFKHPVKWNGFSVAAAVSYGSLLSHRRMLEWNIVFLTLSTLLQLGPLAFLRYKRFGGDTWSNTNGKELSYAGAKQTTFALSTPKERERYVTTIHAVPTANQRPTSLGQGR